MNDFSKREKTMALIAACIGVFITPLLSTPFNMAEVRIQEEFFVSDYALGWMSTLYLLSIVVFMMPAGKLCSIYGKKYVFEGGVLLTLVSVLLALIPSGYEILCVLRIVMGAGVALISCSGISIVTDVFPPAERGWAMGICMACIYVGLSVGPLIGVLIGMLDWWRIILVIPIPICIIALIFISKINLGKDFAKTSFDIMGAIYYAVGIAFTIYGMSCLPQMWAVVMLIGGLVILAFFVKIELGKETPMVNLKVFGIVPFRRALIALILNYAASGAIVFFMNLYLQKVGGISVSESGFILLVQPVVQTVVTVIAGKYSSKTDDRVFPTVGMLVITLGLFMLALMDTNVDVTMVIVALVVLGIGFGLFSAPNTNAIMSSVKHDQINDASALMNTMRQTGMVISTGIGMVVIAAVIGSDVKITEEYYDDFITVLRISWSIFIAFGIVGALFSWFRGEKTE